MRLKLLLLVILLFGLVMRLIWIDRVPPGISHDELDYFLGGKFLAFTGSDLTGTWKWWQLTPMQTGTLTAELTPLYFVPAAALLGNSLLAAKITPVLVGTLIALLTYLLMYRLSKQNKKLSLIAMILAIINPWNFILSRTGYEVTFASFWYLASIVAYLYIDDKKANKSKNYALLLISLLSFFFGYFSYHGFKFLAPFIVVGTLWGKHFIDEKPFISKKHLVSPLLFILLPAALLLFSATHSSVYGNRIGEMGILNLGKYTNTVNLQRQLSMVNRLNPIVFNKFTLYVKDEMIAYLSFFSPSRLFLNTNDIFNLNFPNHGYFYLIEIVFIGIGIFLALKNQRYFILILLLLCSPIPTLVHDGVSYTIRSSFAAVPLTCLSAIGFYTLIKKSKPLFLSTIFLLILSVAYFGYLYFYSYSILSADQYMLDYRLLSSYLSRSVNQVQTTVVSDSPYHIFRDYIFYANVLKKNNAASFQNQFRAGLYANYALPNLLISSKCEILKNPPPGQVIVHGGFYIDCIQKFKNSDYNFVNKLESMPELSLGSPIDSRTYFRIFNPAICIEDRAGGFIHITHFNQLNIEQLSDKDFCSTWTF